MELLAKFQWTDPQNYPISQAQGILCKKGKGVGARGSGNLRLDLFSFNVRRYTCKFSPTLIFIGEVKKDDTNEHIRLDEGKANEASSKLFKDL